VIEITHSLQNISQIELLHPLLSFGFHVHTPVALREVNVDLT